jgi:hypothetical protein
VSCGCELYAIYFLLLWSLHRQGNQREFFDFSRWTGIPGGSMQIDAQTRMLI